MGTKTYNNYQDLITFSRASAGYALRPVSYGSELIQNGTYDSDLTGWDDDSIGSGTATVSSGQVSLTRADSSNRGGISQSHTLVSGKIYLLSFELVSGAVQAKYKGGSGSASQYFNNEDWNQLTTAGIYQTRFVATGTDGDIVFLAINNGVTAVLDNVSVKEVTFDESDGTLTLFEHPDNIPRVEYDADGNRLGLLVEESRTNLIPYSKDFTNAAWTKTYSIAVSASSVTSPDGQQNAYDLTGIESSDGDIGIADFVTASASTTYTGTFWFKAKNASDVGKYVRLRLKRNGGTFIAQSESVQLTSEWVRHEVTLTLLSDNTGIALIVTKDTSKAADDRADECLIFGAQLEAGSFPTSYIKTTGSTATRSADVASIPVADFGYNQSEGTLFVEANAPDGSNQNRLSQLVTSGGATNRVVDLHRVTDDIVMYNGTTTMTGDAFAASNDIKAAGAYKSGDYALVSDGGSATTTSDSTVYTPDTLTIGMNGASSRHLNGHIKKLTYYPRRLTNAQLVELTS